MPDAAESVAHHELAEASGLFGLGIEYKLGPEFSRPVLARTLVLAVLTGLCAGVGQTSGMAAAVAWVTGPLALYNLSMYLWRRRFRTRVTAQGLQIRGYFNHFVP
jgi:hypothetical protein